MNNNAQRKGLLIRTNVNNSNRNNEHENHFYDCYPPQFIDDERVQANRLRRAPQWEAFTKYLGSKGKLR